MTLEAVFTFEKDTKNCRRFAELPAGGLMIANTVYLQKDALEAAFGKLPERVKVTVEGIE